MRRLANRSTMNLAPLLSAPTGLQHIDQLEKENIFVDRRKTFANRSTSENKIVDEGDALKPQLVPLFSSAGADLDHQEIDGFKFTKRRKSSTLLTEQSIQPDEVKKVRSIETLQPTVTTLPKEILKKRESMLPESSRKIDLFQEEEQTTATISVHGANRKKSFSRRTSVYEKEINLPVNDTEPSNSSAPLQDKRLSRSSLHIRSSLALRGKRASSLGLGISILPHPSILVADYHKHISPEFPGPLRMRQLLLWGCQHVAEDNAYIQAAKKHPIQSPAYQMNAIVSDLMEDLIQGLIKSEVNTSWYNRPADCQFNSATVAPSFPAMKLPNPRNEELMICLAEYRKLEARVKEELNAWKLLQERLEQDRPATPADPPVHNPEDFESLDKHTQALMSSMYELSEWTKKLPFQVDRFLSAMQITKHFEVQSRQFCEDVFRQIYAQFFDEERETHQLSDPLEVLKALSRKAPAKTSGNDE